jgi:hypothetical protein
MRTLRVIASVAAAIVLGLSALSARAERAIAQAPWPKVVATFPAEETDEANGLTVGRYQVLRRPPASAEERAGGGTAGPMIEITLRDSTTKWKARVLEQSCGERLLEDFNGRPQLEIWTRGGGGAWSRELLRYLAGEYRSVRVDQWEESPTKSAETARTKPPFPLHGNDNGEQLYFIKTDIPAEEEILADTYRIESLEDQFPQIIQRHNYDTIVFIEALCDDLMAIAPEKQSTEEIGKTVTLEVGGDRLIFHSRSDQRRTVSLRVENRTTTLGQQRFTSAATAALVGSLMNLVGDLATTEDCREVRFEQFGTRAYKNRTVVEFDFGAKVVELEAMSNGPRDAERLYILDLMDRRKSYFWGR